jgi:hypothetical protein
MIKSKDIYNYTFQYNLTLIKYLIDMLGQTKC